MKLLGNSEDRRARIRVTKLVSAPWAATYRDKKLRIFNLPRGFMVEPFPHKGRNPKTWEKVRTF